MTTSISISRLRLCAVALMLISLVLLGCATNKNVANHSFSYDSYADKWVDQIDLIAYDYGGQYSRVRKQVEEGAASLGGGIFTYGGMPVGDYLFVRWRIKGTGEVMEDRVDLRNLLPANMNEHGITFVIDGRQLYVFLVTPHKIPFRSQPVLRTQLSQFKQTYEIYPTNSFKK